MEPRLLFSREIIERVTNERWLKGRANQRLFDLSRQWLTGEDYKSLRDFGELYIYQVGDLYEIDYELTSMLDSHILVLAKAAFATGRKVPCKLVEPKCRRDRRRSHGPARPTVPSIQPVALGQLPFNLD